MPRALSQSTMASIRAKYQSQRIALEGEKDREQRRQRDAENAARATARHSLERLDTEERAANTKTKGETDDIRARYGQQYRSFQETLSKLARDTASKLGKVDARIAVARGELFRLHWEKEKRRRQLKAFEEVRFSNYVKRVFLGSWAA